MKKIYLLRHAKAEKEAADDFSRRLSKKGKEELKLLFERLKKHDLSLDKIFASPAKRTQSTAEKLAKFYALEDKIEFVDGLYEQDAGEIFEWILGLSAGLENVLIVGHNPALLELSELLSTLCLTSFPTASMLGLEFELDDFKGLEKHSGRLVFFEHIKPL
ncbi:phosphohistidine phosphatase SixA [Campylobacter sp.]|uniref:phosphohistidine phosphatase SixA n=1 Tax=Campylobacter sp. TaxID=205 RepID=UPI0026DC8706|nr:phosphohistidine phosphatase SixA [Campylobacter sp.]MDO4673922.1 phosphohistidine phosphatase SixA [Campylobacter sp.]